MSETADQLRRFQEGDRGAFESLFHEQSPCLFTTALRILDHPGLAEGGVQETFVRFLQGRAPFRQKESASRWLARVTARIALDMARKAQSQRRREKEYSMYAKQREKAPTRRW